MAFAGRLTDINRERRIQRLRRELATCQEADRGPVWDKLRAEINARSSRMVARMERERGLR